MAEALIPDNASPPATVASLSDPSLEEISRSSSKPKAVQRMARGGKRYSVAIIRRKPNEASQSAASPSAASVTHRPSSGFGDLVRRRRRSVIETKDATVMIEEEHTCTIDPHANVWRYWDFLLIACLLVVALFTPWEVAFLSYDDTFSFVLNRFLDSVFVLDTIRQFFVPFDDADGRTVTNHCQIAANYAKGWLFVDLVSLFPFDLLSQSNADAVGKLAILRTLRLLRLVKLLRVLRASRVLSRWRSRLGVSHAVSSLVRALGFFAIIIHWGACFWYLAATLHNIDGTLDDTWVDEADLSTAHTASRYLASVYFAASTSSTVGYGDISAVTDVERGVSIMLMIVGGGLYAFMVGSVQTIIGSMDEARQQFDADSDNLNLFMASEKLPPALRVEIREFFDQTLHVHRERYYRDILRKLSPMLRRKVAAYCHMQWITGVTFLACSDREEMTEFAANVAVRMRAEAFAPFELILRPGHVNRRLFIIRRGLAVRRGVGRVMGVGAWFGEEMILSRGRVLHEGVSSITLTLCMTLHRDDLAAVLDSGHFERTRRTLRKAVVKLALRQEFVRCARLAQLHARKAKLRRVALALGKMGMRKRRQEGLRAARPAQGSRSPLSGLLAAASKVAAHGDVLDAKGILRQGSVTASPPATVHVPRTTVTTTSTTTTTTTSGQRLNTDVQQNRPGDDDGDDDDDDDDDAAAVTVLPSSPPPGAATGGGGSQPHRPSHPVAQAWSSPTKPLAKHLALPLRATAAAKEGATSGNQSSQQIAWGSGVVGTRTAAGQGRGGDDDASSSVGSSSARSARRRRRRRGNTEDEEDGEAGGGEAGGTSARHPDSSVAGAMGVVAPASDQVNTRGLGSKPEDDAASIARLAKDIRSSDTPLLARVMTRAALYPNSARDPAAKAEASAALGIPDSGEMTRLFRARSAADARAEEANEELQRLIGDNSDDGRRRAAAASRTAGTSDDDEDAVEEAVGELSNDETEHVGQWAGSVSPAHSPRNVQDRSLGAASRARGDGAQGLSATDLRSIAVAAAAGAASVLRLVGSSGSGAAGSPVSARSTPLARWLVPDAAVASAFLAHAHHGATAQVVQHSARRQIGRAGQALGQRPTMNDTESDGVTMAQMLAVARKQDAAEARGVLGGWARGQVGKTSGGVHLQDVAHDEDHGQDEPPSSRLAASGGDSTARVGNNNGGGSGGGGGQGGLGLAASAQFPAEGLQDLLLGSSSSTRSRRQSATTDGASGAATATTPTPFAVSTRSREQGRSKPARRAPRNRRKSLGYRDKPLMVAMRPEQASEDADGFAQLGERPATLAGLMAAARTEDASFMSPRRGSPRGSLESIADDKDVVEDDDDEEEDDAADETRADRTGIALPTYSAAAPVTQAAATVGAIRQAVRLETNPHLQAMEDELAVARQQAKHAADRASAVEAGQATLLDEIRSLREEIASMRRQGAPVAAESPAAGGWQNRALVMSVVALVATVTTVLALVVAIA